MDDPEADTARVLKSPRHPHERKPKKKKSSFAVCVDRAFDDKRVTIFCISCWFVVCMIGFTWLGIFGSEYMHFGPSPTLTYMGVNINSMSSYLAVVGFVVISTAGVSLTLKSSPFQQCMQLLHVILECNAIQ
jgi:hypothetical protein